MMRHSNSGTTWGRRTRLLSAAMVLAWPALGEAAVVEVRQTDRGAAVTIDGQPFAEYLAKSGHQPVIWPIIGPAGQPMTRQYPLAERLPAEKDDHPHHRSLWFNHGSVNGLDFWMEPNSDVPGAKNNQIEHREFAVLESSGDSARVVARNDWTSGGMKICEDERKIEFSVDEHGRWIDFAVLLRAGEGELTLGDTKEGSLGLRVAGPMSVDEKLGGRITNSRGQTNEDAWGRAAEWVDYRGPVDGKPAGITVFDLPDSFRHPCRWHVRTYGLFAANPFGQHEFPPDNATQGPVTLAKGKTLRLHYRILFSAGELTAEQIQKISSRYSEQNRREPRRREGTKNTESRER